MQNYLILLLFSVVPSECGYWGLQLSQSTYSSSQSNSKNNTNEEKDKEIAELKSELEWNKQQLEQVPSCCLPYVNYYGVHTIKIPNWKTTQIFCNPSGWTVIQRRLGGPVSFAGNWTEYQNGFGYLADEFFLGLETIHRITISEPHELYISMTDINNKTAHALYDNFAIGGEETGYMLQSLGTYNGTAGDSMRSNLGKKFTTHDRDNDGWRGYNCAELKGGGWWFSDCGLCNLNGPYTEDNGIFWYRWRKWQTINNVEMMIRRKSVRF